MPHVHWYVVHILVRSNARGFYKMVRNKDTRGSEQKKLLSSAIISGGHSSSCSHMSVRLKNPPIQPNLHLLNVTGPRALQLSLPV